MSHSFDAGQLVGRLRTSASATRKAPEVRATPELLEEAADLIEWQEQKLNEALELLTSWTTLSP